MFHVASFIFCTCVFAFAHTLDFLMYSLGGMLTTLNLHVQISEAEVSGTSCWWSECAAEV